MEKEKSEPRKQRRKEKTISKIEKEDTTNGKHLYFRDLAGSASFPEVASSLPLSDYNHKFSAYVYVCTLCTHILDIV